MSQQPLPCLPYNFFANLLTPTEYDCLCCEIGTVAGITPSNYSLYTKQYVNQSAFRYSERKTQNNIPN